MSAASPTKLRALRAEVDDMRQVPPEVADLDRARFAELDWLDWAVIARELRRRTGRRLAVERAELTRGREPSLIASMGEPGATVQRWQGVIGAEGRLTGDGRLIELESLTWADFPLPLRWAPVDWGGHDGAVLVGLIEAIKRGEDGMIWARGVLDLGSEVGREATRLLRGGFLAGVSMDLDSVDAAQAAVLTTDGDTTTEGEATVTRGGRVRAATLVAVPAFVEARIALVDDDPRVADDALELLTLADPDSPAPADCGCAAGDSALHTGPAPIPAAPTTQTERPRR